MKRPALLLGYVRIVYLYLPLWTPRKDLILRQFSVIKKRGRAVAGLAQLKLAMGTSILLVALVFVSFLAIVMFILQEFVLQIGLSYWIAMLIGLPVLFILFQYLIGPAIVKMSTRLQYLQQGENPWLESTVKELADKNGQQMPKLAIVPDKTPNAFVFGRTANSATLAVHEGLLRSLNENEVKGVIGHELGHLKHKDYVVMTVLSALPLRNHFGAPMLPIFSIDANCCVISGASTTPMAP